MRLWVLSKSVSAWTVLTFLLLLSLATIPALAAHNPQTGIIVTDDKEFPPFAFLDAEGNPRGITIDIWTLWSKKTGIPVKFDLVKWDDALKAVREGRADAVGGLFLTPERRAYFDYTKEIIRIPTAIFFHRQIAGIKSLKDLSGFQVGVIRGDSSEELLRTKHPDINLLVYSSTDDLVKAAIAGRIRVFVADEPVALFYLAKYPGGETFRRSTREIAINRQYAAVRKGNTLLLTTVQSGFDKISEAEINNIVTVWSGKSTRANIPWREIGLILFVILFIITVVFIWNMQLRRRVLKATSDLEEKNKDLELSREAIHLSEERYRELMEHANSVILRMDKEGQILFLNEFALRFFGFRKEEVIGRNVVGTIVPEKETTGRNLAPMIKDIAVNPIIYANNENENMRSNGERVWMAWTNKPVYNPDGEVSEILCIGNDITERKRAEEELERVRRRLEVASTAGRVALWELNLASGRLEWSEAVDTMLGHPPMAFQQTLTAWQDIIHPEDRRRLDEALAAHLDHAVPYDVEYRVRRADGAWVWWRDTGVAQRDEQGKPFSMAGACADVTDRHLAEEALLERQGIINAIVETSQDWIWAIDAKGVHTFSNPAIRTILGREENEILGRTNLDFLHEDDLAKVQSIIPECIRDRRGWENLLLRWRHKDGTYHYLESNAVPILDVTGKLHGFRGVDRDITERKRAEEALRESEERFAKAFQSSPAPLVISEIDTGRFIDVNDAWVKMLGYTREEQVGQTSTEIGIWMNPDDRNRIVQKIRNQGFIKEEPIDFITKAGRHVRALWSAETIVLGPKKVMLSMLYDETERKQFLEELRRSEARLHSVIEGTNVGTWEWNVQAGETVFNERWAEMAGYRLEELAPVSIKTWRDLAHPDDLEESDRQLMEVFGRKRPYYDIECRMKHRNGNWIWVNDRGKVIEWSADGKPVRMVGTHTDITERKQTEQQIIEYNQLLHSILAASPVGIGKVKDRKISWVNDTLCRISGYSKHEMEGRDASIFYESPEEYERVGNLIYDEGQVETRLTAKDGSKHDVLIQIAPTDSYSYIFSIVDLTQQKKDAEDLAFYKFALDHARDSLLGVGADARILYANDSAAQSLDYAKDELLTMKVADIDPVYPQEKWLDLLKTLRQKRSLLFESTQKKKNGTLFPVEISINLYKYHGEEYLFAFIRDITLRKQMTEELVKAQGLLNAAFMQSPSGILIADAPDVKIKMANPAALGIRGAENSHLVDIDVVLHSSRWQTFYPDGRPVPPEELPLSRAVLQGETCRNVEVIIRNDQGDNRWVSANAAPVRDHDGHVIAGIVVFHDITESKHMEAALRQSEEKFKAIFEESPFSIIVNDLQTGQFSDVNRAYTDIYQSHLDKDFIIGKTALEIGLSVDADDNKRLNEKLAKTGRIDLDEVRVVDTNGVNHVLLLSSRVIEIGGRKQVLTTLQNITERKQMEETLKSSLVEIQKAALRYEALIAASNTGAWEYNNDIGYLWCSPEYFSMLGRDIADFDLREGMNIDQTWLDMLHPEDRQRAADHFAAYLKNPSGMYEQSFRMLHQDGSWRWIWSRGKTLTNRDGNLTNITVGTHIDITPNKNMEEGLKWLSAVIEQADEEVIITDPDGTIQYINPAFERVTGYSKQEALGQNPRMLKSGVHEASFYDQLWHTITSGHVWSGRIVNKRKDGKLIHEDAIISPLFSTEGLCTGYASLKRDVTDRINLEDQLRQAQKMEAIGTLAGGIAHDFNNILGSIMGYTELAHMKASDAEMDRYLDQVLKASDRAKSLVAQILTFSRQSSREKKPLSVTPIFKEVLKLLRSSLPSNIQIRQNFSCPIDAVHADPTQIYQVLMNLCTNAAHAMREEGGILEITLEQEHIPNPHMHYEYNLKQGDYLKLIVRDNGCGMEPSTIEHIFEPFFTTKKEGEGTGLGLSVVYGIVKDHGGSIHVFSEPEKGTMFTILLPLIEVETRHREEEATPIPKGRGRILVVDDEEALAQMSRDMLTSLGYEVTVRYSSLDALEAFRKNPDKFDLVFTDMTMPNMSGAMLAREMLKIRHDIPIILVTGFSERINEEDAKSIGIREFLMKPVSLTNLSRTVGKLLNPDTAPTA